MAGCSLTLVFLDDELETLWRAPADTPAYRKGIATASGWHTAPRRVAVAAVTAAGHRRGLARVPSLRGRTATAILTAVAAAIDDAADELGRDRRGRRRR